jgi:hypothetical protein
VKKTVKRNFQLHYGPEQWRLFFRTVGSRMDWEGASRDLNGYRLCRVTKMLWLIASYQAVDTRALFSPELEKPCVNANK